MTATARLKQLLYIAAALALVGLGLVAAVSTASPARAAGTTPCVPSNDTLSAWADSGAPLTMHDDATPPADPDGTDETSTTNLVRYVKVSETEHVLQAAVPATPDTALQRHSWNPQGPVDESITVPKWPTPQQGKWTANTSTYNGTDPLGVPFQEGGGNGGDNASWFYWTFTPGTPGTAKVSHTDYTWQKQTRTFTEGVNCPPPVECPDGDFNGTDLGCGTPPEECPKGDFNGTDLGCGTPPEKKVYVCKYTGTPGVDEVLQSGNNPIEVSVNSIIPGFDGDPADLIGQAFADGQTKSVVIAVSAGPGGGQGDEPTIEDCPAPQGPPDDACPNIPGPQEGVPEGYVVDENGDCVLPPPDVCPNIDGPQESVPHDYEIDENGDCVIDDDDEEPPAPGPTCQEDPTLPGCDENNPPVPPNDPTPPNGPSNHPGPTVKGAQATAPTASQSTPKAAGTPAARVPTAIDAGLAPAQRDLTGDGGPLGLLGVAAALAGTVLVGASLRPRRRRSLTG